MPSLVSEEKTKARKELLERKITLKRDVFFVPGWTDQDCSCWTEPNECGADRSKDWEYTVKDWEHIITNPEKMHYVKLVEDESKMTIKRNKNGKITCVKFNQDPSYAYTNFFQFAELLKKKIRALKVKNYDLIGHSMGGLDIIAATALDRKSDDFPEVQEFIITPPLKPCHVITVATPYKGSRPADIVKNTQIDECFRKEWSDGIRTQCNNLSHESPFIKIVNDDRVRRRLLKNTRMGVDTFSGGSDDAVLTSESIIEGAMNHPALELASHSGRKGITQDQRLHRELFKLLAS